jgi:hypothetical protein
MVISPELADVLSAIVCRVRDSTGAIPLVAAYDPARPAELAPDWLTDAATEQPKSRHDVTTPP